MSGLRKVVAPAMTRQLAIRAIQPATVTTTHASTESTRVPRRPEGAHPKMAAQLAESGLTNSHYHIIITEKPAVLLFQACFSSSVALDLRFLGIEPFRDRSSKFPVSLSPSSSA
jgi:hypothetical protein